MTTKRATLLDNLEAFFRLRPRYWIDGKRLEDVAGAYAWRSRVSDLRTRRGMVIENRIRKLQNPAGRTYTASEYRFVPPAAPAEPSLGPYLFEDMDGR